MTYLESQPQGVRISGLNFICLHRKAVRGCTGQTYRLHVVLCKPCAPRAAARVDSCVQVYNGSLRVRVSQVKPRVIHLAYRLGTSARGLMIFPAQPGDLDGSKGPGSAPQRIRAPARRAGYPQNGPRVGASRVLTVEASVYVAPSARCSQDVLECRSRCCLQRRHDQRTIGTLDSRRKHTMSCARFTAGTHSPESPFLCHLQISQRP